MGLNVLDGCKFKVCEDFNWGHIKSKFFGFLLYKLKSLQVDNTGFAGKTVSEDELLF